MSNSDQFAGCILGGAIGDAYGSGYENALKEDTELFHPFGKPEKPIPKWQITDDTQLTLITSEVLAEDKAGDPELLANRFLAFYKTRQLVGVGSSTLKAMRELELGGHWSQVGRRGEYAAGNGAAMRIAPIAFYSGIKRSRIREICSITHHNEEAYIGALSVVLSIRMVLEGRWTGSENLLEIIIDQIPDTRVRDRLIELNKLGANIDKIGKHGTSGYVVDSVPLSIAMANRVTEIGLEEMYNRIIKFGGDTDTNCSISGQISGTLLGAENIPESLMEKLKELREYSWIEKVIENYKK